MTGVGRVEKRYIHSVETSCIRYILPHVCRCLICSDALTCSDALICIVMHLPGWTQHRSVQHMQFLDHHPSCFDCNLAVLISSRLYLEDSRINIANYLCFFQKCFFWWFLFQNFDNNNWSALVVCLKSHIHQGYPADDSMYV